VDRRAFVAGIWGLIAAPLTADGQQTAMIARIRMLGLASPTPDSRGYHDDRASPSLRVASN
jgi:hypothetical protein